MSIPRFDSWIRSATGAAAAGASVYLCLQPAAINNPPLPPAPLAQLYSDNAGALPIAQPMIADGYGHVNCYIATGTYTVVIYYGGSLVLSYPDQNISLGSGGGKFYVTGLPSVITAPAGDVITADGTGNIQDGGTLLSSLASAVSVTNETNRALAAEALLAPIASLVSYAPIASPSFTGNTTVVGLENTQYITTGGDAGAKINAAFALLPANGGVVVVPSSGTTYAATTQISIPANCTLQLGAVLLTVASAILVANKGSIVGLGMQSVITPVGMSATTSAVITNLGNSGLNETTATVNSNLYFANFNITATAAGNSSTTIEGLWLAACTYCLVDNVYVTGCKGSSGGIRSYGGTLNTLRNCTAVSCAYIGLSIALDTQWTIESCRAISNGNNGIDTGIGASQGRVVNCESTNNGANGVCPDNSSDVQVVGGNFSGNTQYGIAVTNAQARVSIIGARVDGNTLAGVLINNNSDYVSIVSCIIANNGTHGVFLNAVVNCTVQACEILDNSQTTTNTSDGVHIQSSGGNCLNNIITGNTIINVAGVTQRYGVAIDQTGGGSAGQSTIVGNNLAGNQSGTTTGLTATDVLLGNRLDATGVLSLTTTAGMGNGASGNVTVLAKGTGSGPATPGTIVKWAEISLAGSTYWVPLCQ